MATIKSSWIIGALELAGDATITVNGADAAVVPAGEYYLRDGTVSLSLLDEVLAAVAPFMTTPAIFVGQDRRIRVTAGAAFTWDIPAALQALLGFGASIPSTSSATAADVSTHLWAAGWPETTVGHPVQTSGWDASTRIVTRSPSGQTIRTTLQGGTATNTGLAWTKVLQGRAWTAGEDDGAPGDFRRFYVEVLNPGYRWKLYSQMLDNAASPTATIWSPAYGPYKSPTLTEEWWRRSVKNADTWSDIRIDGTKTSEIA